MGLVILTRDEERAWPELRPKVQELADRLGRGVSVRRLAEDPWAQVPTVLVDRVEPGGVK